MSVCMSGLGRWAKGWGHGRELPAGGIRASQGTFSSLFIRMFIMIYYTPGIYADGYIVFAFPFVRSFVRSFVS